MGNASSELQHIANALSGMSADEKKFMEAVFENKVVAARDILMANPNVIYARTKEWSNAWHIAAHSGTLEMLEVLHRHGKGGTRKPLPGEPAPVNHKNKKGITPLMVAVQAGREQVMQFLLAIGAQARARDYQGNTCVHYAALLGHVKILEMLLATADAEEEGEEEEPPRNQGRAAVQQLEKFGAAARVLGAGAASQLGMDGLGLQVVLAKGRYVDFRNEAGLQPLHFAVWGGHIEAVKVLFTYGAHPTERSGTDSTAEVTCNGGSTPLHVAGLRNNVPMVQFLLERHVKLVAASNPSNPPTDPRTIKDNYAFTPYQLAKNLLREDVLQLLDPRGKLPDIAVIRQSASMLRQGSMRKTAGSSKTLDRVSDDDGLGSEFRRVTLDPSSNPSASASSSNMAGGADGGAAWDPFGTGAFVAVPALPPPPAKTRRTSGTGGAADGGRSPAKAAAAATPPRLSPLPPAPKAAAHGGGAAAATPAAPAAAAPAAAAAAAVPASASAAAAAAPEPPAEFVCPITNQVMDDPVVAADGRTYERTAIEMWLDIGNADFPGGEAKVTSTALTPNEGLKARIDAWRKEHKR